MQGETYNTLYGLIGAIVKVPCWKNVMLTLKAYKNMLKTMSPNTIAYMHNCLDWELNLIGELQYSKRFISLVYSSNLA